MEDFINDAIRVYIQDLKDNDETLDFSSKEEAEKVRDKINSLEDIEEKVSIAFDKGIDAWYLVL